jgi:hypothetical protein
MFPTRRSSAGKINKTLYVKHKIEARSHNHCYRVNAISITYFECVFVALGIQHAMRTRRIVIRGLPDSYDIFPPFLTKRFSKKKIFYIKCALWFPLQICPKNFSS